MEDYKTQIKIILSIFGDNFDPSELSKITGITPTDLWVIGDEIPRMGNLTRKDNKKRLRKESAWKYSYGIETLDFEEVSTVFIEKIEDSIPFINDYIVQSKLTINIDIVIEIENEEVPAISFNKKFISIVNRFGAKIDIDMYI